MSFNSRYKGGPNIAEAEEQGATHTVTECHGCGCQWRLELHRIMFNRQAAPRNVPVNHLPWRCPNCGGNNISVSLRAPAKLHALEGEFKVSGLRPRPRRSCCHEPGRRRLSPAPRQPHSAG